jgi:hypothetical protein
MHKPGYDRIEKDMKVNNGYTQAGLSILFDTNPKFKDGLLDWQIEDTIKSMFESQFWNVTN